MPWAPLPTSDAVRSVGPTPLAYALGAVAKALGAPSLDAVVIVHERWGDLVGEEVAMHARPVGIVDGRLRISVDGAGWASHLRWAEPGLLARLEQLLGGREVTAIAVSVDRRRLRPL